GTVILPDPDRLRDPRHWVSLINQYRATLWNTVPALMEMLVTFATGADERLPTVRRVMLSGDWIPLSLPGRIHRICPATVVTSLGGATEASIGPFESAIGKSSPDWISLPYGKALPGQTVEILDADLERCPPGIEGRIMIGGEGLAVGYLDDPEQTN